MSVKISKLNIKIGKKEISLTLEEAKELQEILNDTFGEQKTMCIPSYPVIIPPSPVIIKRSVIKEYQPWRRWDVTWTANNKATGEYTIACIAAE